MLDVIIRTQENYSFSLVLSRIVEATMLVGILKLWYFRGKRQFTDDIQFNLKLRLPSSLLTTKVTIPASSHGCHITMSPQELFQARG